MDAEVETLLAELDRAPKDFFLEDRVISLFERAAALLRRHTAPSDSERDFGRITLLENALRPFANSDARHIPAYMREHPASAVAGVCDFTYSDLIDAHVALYGEEMPLPTDLDGRAINPGIAKYGFGPRQGSPFPAVVRPLEWEPYEGGYQADALSIGKIRIRGLSEAEFAVRLIVAGSDISFIEGVFGSPEKAREAAQAEFERQVHRSLVPDVVPVQRKVAFETLALGARFKYSRNDARVWVKIANGLVAKWDDSLVAATWVGQTVCSFDDDDDFSKLVYLVPPYGDAVTPAKVRIPRLSRTSSRRPIRVRGKCNTRRETPRGLSAA